jgi:hypothetical protein
VGIGKLILSMYKWDKLSAQSLLEMRAKVDNQIDGFTELEIKGQLGWGGKGDLNAGHKALIEIDEEIARRGL